MPKHSSKRKQDEETDALNIPQWKFKKANSQKSYDWYIVDSEGLWHCRNDTAYAHGHVPAKTTNHDRHATCKLYKMDHSFIKLTTKFDEGKKKKRFKIFFILIFSFSFF